MVNLPIVNVPSLQLNQPISKAITFFLEKYDVIMILDETNRFEGMIRVHDVVGKGISTTTLCKSIMRKDIPRLQIGELDDITPLEIGEMMIDGATRYIPVLNAQMRLKGAIKDLDLLYLLPKSNQIMQAPVKDAANWQITTISSIDSIGQAIAKIREYGFSKIPVLNNEGEIEGLINNRSLLRPYPERRSTAGDIGGDRDKDWHLLPLADFIQDAIFVPENALLGEVLDEFVNKSTNMLILGKKGSYGILTPLDIIQFTLNQRKKTGFNVFVQQAPDNDIKDHTVRKGLSILKREEKWLGSNCNLHIRFKRNLSQSKRGQFSVSASTKLISDRGFTFNSEGTEFGAEKAVNTALDNLSRIISETKKKKLAKRDQSPSWRKLIDTE